MCNVIWSRTSAIMEKIGLVIWNEGEPASNAYMLVNVQFDGQDKITCLRILEVRTHTYVLEDFTGACIVLPWEYKRKQILVISEKSLYEHSTPCSTLLTLQIQHGAYTPDANYRRKNAARGVQIKTTKYGDYWHFWRACGRRSKLCWEAWRLHLHTGTGQGGSQENRSPFDAIDNWLTLWQCVSNGC